MIHNFIDKSNLLKTLQQISNVRIELGPGTKRFINVAITIDKFDSESVDILADFEAGLYFLPDNSVDYFYSSHVMEHIDNLELLLREIHRVLKPGGTYEFVVPHFANPYFYSDYTHKQFFGLYSMSYFCKTKYFKRGVPQFYNDFDYVIKNVRIEFTSPFWFRYPFKKIWQFLFNISKGSQELFEESFCYTFPAYQLRFIIGKK